MKRYVLFLKIGLLVGLSLSIAFLLLKGLYFTAVMCFIILLGTAFSLYQDQRKMLQRMEHLIANIHYGDMNLSFPVPSTDGPEANLTRAMNEALSAFEGIVFYGCHVFYNLAGNCFFPLSGSAENASEDGASDC